MKGYIIELSEFVWLSSWEGAPGRTLRREKAQVYIGIAEAEADLKQIKTYHIFKNAKIIELKGERK